MRRQNAPWAEPFVLRRLKMRPLPPLACLLVVCLIPLAAKAGLQQPNAPRNVPEFLNHLPDQNDQERMRQKQQNGQQNFAAANAYRQKQISDETAKLLQLATDLKTEVDKGGKDTLSLAAIRKVESIEKLAHNLHRTMTSAASN